MRALICVLLISCGGSAALEADAGTQDAGRDAGADAGDVDAGPDAGSTTTGAITVTADSSSTLVDLTSEGALSWSYYGDPPADNGTLITMSAVGGGPSQKYSSDLRPITWKAGPDGARAGLFRIGVGSGFKLTAPGAATSRTLTVHVAGFQSSGVLTAQLVDGSGEYTDLTALASGQYDRNYSITYAGADLVVSWVMSAGGGHVNLAAAALQ